MCVCGGGGGGGGYYRILESSYLNIVNVFVSWYVSNPRVTESHVVIVLFISLRFVIQLYDMIK